MGARELLRFFFKPVFKESTLVKAAKGANKFVRLILFLLISEQLNEIWERSWTSKRDLVGKNGFRVKISLKRQKIYIYTGSNYLGMNQGTLPPCLFFKIEPNTVLLISEIYRVFSCMLGKWSDVLFFFENDFGWHFTVKSFDNYFLNFLVSWIFSSVLELKLLEGWSV